MRKCNMLLNAFNVFLVLIIAVLYFLNCDYQFMSIQWITIIAVIINVLILLRHYYNYKSFKSAYFLFQFLSLPFLYGQLVVRYIFNYIPRDTFDMSRLVSTEYTIKAVFLIILCQLFLDLGYNLYNKNNKNNNFFDDSIIDYKLFKRLGYVLIIISIIPTFINYYEFIKSCLVYGYSGKHLVNTYGLSSIFSKIVPFFYIGILCLLYGYKQNRRITTILIYFSIIFYGSQMFFGNRGMPLLMVVCIIWFYHYYIKKIKFKKAIVLVICSFFIITLMNIIRENRRYGIEKWIGNIYTIMSDSIVQNNQLFDINYEVGTTIYPITYTLEHIPKDINYKYGINYLYSIYSIIRVNMSSSRDDVFIEKMNIAEEIVNHSGATFGGSYIQEAYANFGWFCLVFTFIFGILLKKMDIYLFASFSPISHILITYFLTSLLWIIRNTMISLPRELVWYILSTYLLYKLIGRKKNEKSRIES